NIDHVHDPHYFRAILPGQTLIKTLSENRALSRTRRYCPLISRWTPDCRRVALNSMQRIPREASLQSAYKYHPLDMLY
ncbi:MAG: hypothetical protein KAS19_05795, partial [Anaerolineales bacterium]|nr:hypothetical protein [Anaerolineales bacterium]